MPATVYSNGLVERLMTHIADGASLTKACADERIERSTVVRWIMWDLHGIADKYRLARQMGAEMWAAEVLDLSDESRCASGDMALLGSYKLRVDSRRCAIIASSD
jgi:hypothetical protein